MHSSDSCSRLSAPGASRSPPLSWRFSCFRSGSSSHRVVSTTSFLTSSDSPLEGLRVVRTPPRTVESDAALQRLLSFPLWLPSDLPCAGPNQRIYDAATRSASLVYQCLAVTERSSETTLRPVVDAGTLEEVSINGLPGYYYQTTVVMPTTGERQTNASLVFEREGTLVTLSPLPQHASRTAPAMLLGKADLIRIAASMTRVHAQ